MAPHEAWPKAKAAARRALEFDEGLSEAHTSMAHAHLHYDWDWEAAERGFRRAIVLNPAYGNAHRRWAGRTNPWPRVVAAWSSTPSTRAGSATSTWSPGSIRCAGIRASQPW